MPYTTSAWSQIDLDLVEYLCGQSSIPMTIQEVQWNLVIVNSVLSPILFTNERCLLFSM